MDTSVKYKEKTRLCSHQETLFRVLGGMKTPVGRYIHVTMLESTNQITLTAMREAWKEVSKHNFLLNACIQSDEEGNFVFKEMKKERLEGDWMKINEGSIEKEEEWHDIAVKEYENLIDFESGPLWNVKMINLPNKDNGIFQNIMMFFSAHSIIDAKSGVNLICNQVLPVLSGKLIECPPIYFAQAMESAVYGMKDKQLLTSERTVPWLYRSVANIFILKNKIATSFFNKESTSPLTTIQSFEIDEEFTGSFLKLCKAKAVSVHSVLMVIIHNALHEARAKFGLSSLNTDDIIYPIDARKFHKDLNAAPTMPLGDYHKMGTHRMKHVPVEQEEIFFTHAKEVNKGIHEQNKPIQEKTSFDCCFHLLQKNNLNTEGFCSLPQPCCFTNLGNCDVISKYENTKDLRIVKQFFSLQTKVGSVLSTWTYQNRMYFISLHGLGHEAGNYLVENIPKSIKLLVEKYA